MNTITQIKAKNKPYERTFAGWLVPPDKVQQYIADYVRDKPKNGDSYRHDWLVKNGYIKAKKEKKKADVIQIKSESVAVQQFVKHLPTKPYCSNNLSQGLKIRQINTALMHAYIQQNGPGMLWSLVFDLDYNVTEKAWADLPPPNFLARTKETGRAHLFYNLQAGVCTTSAARQKPIRYAAAIQRAFTKELRADVGYAGLVCKNPLNSRWETTPIHEEAYNLGDLAASVDLRSAPKEYITTKNAVGLGRNCTAFDVTRIWSYKAIREFWRPGGLDGWHAAVLTKIESVNSEFSKPLPFSEIKATAKSIARWTWRTITPNGMQNLIERTHGSEKQALRGKKSGEVRKAASEQARATARLLRAAGHTQAQIAKELGVSQQLVNSWLRK